MHCVINLLRRNYRPLACWVVLHFCYAYSAKAIVLVAYDVTTKWQQRQNEQQNKWQQQASSFAREELKNITALPEWQQRWRDWDRAHCIITCKNKPIQDLGQPVKLPSIPLSWFSVWQWILCFLFSQVNSIVVWTESMYIDLQLTIMHICLSVWPGIIPSVPNGMATIWGRNTRQWWE